MTTQEQMEHDALRELMGFPYLGLPEYSTDISVQRRLGRLLTDASLRLASNKSKEAAN
jgi:hypothetical protein